MAEADGGHLVGSLGGARVLVARGPRHAEACLLAEAAAWQAAVRADPQRLARPLRIVVPSRSLREHVAAALTRSLGALAGVAVQTHHRLALDVLEGSGEPAQAGSEVFSVLVRRHAHRMPALHEALGDLDDGYGAVAADVADLLDAGLEAGHADALAECLAALPAGGRAAARARAVTEVALAVRASLAHHGVARLADLVRAACRCLEVDAGAALPTGRLVLHGFADATGIVTDFLAQLARIHPTTLLLDHPPDPVRAEAEDPGVAFARRFEERMARVTPEPAAPAAPAPAPARVALFRAPGSDAEVREVARRILRVRREAPEVPWERIGVVSRTPDAYAPAVRVHFDRLGIPCSGVGADGPRSPEGRRVAFLLDLVRDGERTPADRFVDHLEAFGPGCRADLRLGLHALGVARLGDLAGLDPAAALRGKEALALPVRRGVEAGAVGEPDDPAPDAAPRARRRHLGIDALADAVARAREAVSRLADPDAEEPLGNRLEAVKALAARGLGWRDPGRAAPLLRQLDGLAADLPAALPVSRAGLVLILERGLRGRVREPLGGAGGGVQVLDVTAARARTFDHLFVLGMNRDAFPRVVSQDPLLPDRVRRALREVLPDLPEKESGHDEEHFLFAQLVASSPAVTLSWQVMGDDGKARAPSPLVERMRAADEEPPLAPSLLAADDPAEPRPAHERALVAGLAGGHAALRALLPAVLAEQAERDADAPPVADGTAPEIPPADPAQADLAQAGITLAAIEPVAAARVAALAEVDAYRPARAWPGPYLGYVGPARSARDLRGAPLYVTTVEGTARCPWQSFLGRVLGLEAVPDALEALPDAADPLLLGRLVHDVLERIVKEAGVETPPPDALQDAPVHAPAWPDEARLAAMVEEAAERILLDSGIGLRGFARVLAGVALPALRLARDLDWADGPPPVVGAEVRARVSVETARGAEALHFRADRVDRTSDGRLVLTDYKTGKPLSTKAKEETRHTDFVRQVARGKVLQAPAYALLDAGADAGAVGRYLFVGQLEQEPPAREFIASREDAELDAAFHAAMDTVLAGWRKGTLFPRLDASVEDRSGPCFWCDFRAACLQGDSGARRRMADWAGAPPGAGPEAVAHRLWHLAASQGDDRG